MTDQVKGQIVELTESYRRGTLNRRDFIRAVVGLTGSLAGAAGVLEPLGLSSADAAQVSPNDPDLISGPCSSRARACGWAGTFRARRPPGAIRG